MNKILNTLLLVAILLIGKPSFAQDTVNSELLTIDRIFSGEFRQDYERDIQWIENGDAYVTIEKSATTKGADELVRYDSESQQKTVFVSASNLMANEKSLPIESFSLSPDGSKVLIFTNSSRVWRSNTKGDYWVFDLNTKKLNQLGASFESSSLMFAKFSNDNSFVSYVHKFNIYKEDFSTNEVTKLTKDGTGDIINGTFDWVYEEEFGKRDGFSISPSDKHIAFWQLDASATGTLQK